MSEVCEVDVSESTIYRKLKRRGFTRKKVRNAILSSIPHRFSYPIKVTRPARERDEADRVYYKAIIGGHYQPQQLVFVDESHCNRYTTRRSYAWAPCGDRARRRDFFIRGQK